MHVNDTLISGYLSPSEKGKNERGCKFKPYLLVFLKKA